MEQTVLNLVTSKDLKIIVDHEKNFSVKFEGFEELDTSYELEFVPENSEYSTVSFIMGTDIVLDTDENTLTLSFLGNRFNRVDYCGTLKSSSNDENVFLRIDIELNLV